MLNERISEWFATLDGLGRGQQQCLFVFTGVMAVMVTLPCPKLEVARARLQKHAQRKMFLKFINDFTFNSTLTYWFGFAVSPKGQGVALPYDFFRSLINAQTAGKK